MKQHPVLGVLALALLLLASGAVTLYAGEGTVYVGANGECCTLVNGACVPCECPDGASAGAAATPAKSAVATFAGATTQLASAGCDPSRCEPMTPEQCAALGCDPSQCEPMTPDQCAAMGLTPKQCAPGTGTAVGRMINTDVATTSSSGCSPGPECVPSTSCGSVSSCGTGNTSMTLVGVRDAKTGVVTYYAMPVTQAKALLASSESRSADVRSDI